MKTLRPPRHTYLKQGVYYFSWSVLVDVRHHYSRLLIVKSLRTKSFVHAKLSANNLSTKLEEYWFTLRLSEIEVPRGDLLVEGATHDSNLPSITDALDQYLRVKGRAKDKVFARAAKRNIGYLTDHAGLKALDQYITADAVVFRDQLLEKGLKPTSIRRMFGVIKAVLNVVIL